MLQEFFGAALICMGALTVYARVMARSAELHRRPSSRSLSTASLPGREG